MNRDDPQPQDYSPTPDPEYPPPHDPGRDPEGKAPQIAGGVVGAGAGLSMGIVGGPVGMLIGALAGAVGGWWATDKITEDTGTYDDNEDLWFRKHFESPEYQLADRSFEEVRLAYAYGHLAAGNPAYRGRSFTDVESELGRDWARGLQPRHGEWSTARRYAQVGYEKRQAASGKRQAGGV